MSYKTSVASRQPKIQEFDTIPEQVSFENMTATHFMPSVERNIWFLISWLNE